MGDTEMQRWSDWFVLSISRTKTSILYLYFHFFRDPVQLFIGTAGCRTVGSKYKHPVYVDPIVLQPVAQHNSCREYSSFFLSHIIVAGAAFKFVRDNSFQMFYNIVICKN